MSSSLRIRLCPYDERDTPGWTGTHLVPSTTWRWDPAAQILINPT